MNILITGAAGFIGFHLAKRLLDEGHQIIGIDSLNDYYDVSLKHARLIQLLPYPTFQFHYLDISDRGTIAELFQTQHCDMVVHLAAQAGVRYSIQNPHTYVDSNLVGFVNILEGCRHAQIKHLIYASSSSVYGANSKVPFSVTDNVDHPLSLYAATKKANELMAHTYSHLYGLPTTGLRFFTVYGPWGRPDMAYFKFVQAIAQDRPIDVYNHGEMERDFTYIDDIVEGIVRILSQSPQSSISPYKLYNIGNHQPIKLNRFIEVIEQAIGKPAIKNFLPMQPGDVPTTYADIDDLMGDINFKPAISIDEGIERFVQWYWNYYYNYPQTAMQLFPSCRIA